MKKRKTHQSESAAMIQAKLTQENNKAAFANSHYGKIQQSQRWMRNKTRN